jgi:RNA polymerase sigma-70 factor (ECF subfamily)
LQPEAPIQSIDALYSSHHGWLRRWLQRKLGCAHQAADIAHDTFMRVLRRPLVSPLREPRAYLTTIAHSLVVNHWRRVALERAYLEELACLAESSVPSPEDRALILEALCAVDALLSKLPEKARHAFLLAQIDGMTYREIAVELGVSERMVKKYMSRAMLHCLSAPQEAQP